MSKRTASLLILLGGTCMSFVGLLLRLVEDADGFQILAYRSVTISLMVALVACLKRKVSLPVFLRSLDANDLKMGTALAIAFSFYIFAMLHTSVASTLLILTTVPFFAAILAWFFLGEVPARLTWACMIVAVLGVGLMVSDGVELGRSLGNLFALISGLCFAAMLVFARNSKQPDPLGGTFLAGVISMAIGLGFSVTLGNGLTLSLYDLAIILFMGAFTIGLGIALVTWGTGHVPAAEASLLLLIESLLGPIWVWLFLNEAMTLTEITGGALVLLSVATLAISQKEKPIRT
ncbi:MAG: DMT family transporter [Proteobacteria bacterium]|nr:DMT family transporter [Pseudomonadota bacterium]